MTGKKYWLGILVMVLVLGVAAVGCGGNRIEGTWEDELWGTLFIFRGNTVNWGGHNGTFTTRGNNITIDFGASGVERGTFTIDGNILFIIFDDGEIVELIRRR